MGCRILCGLWLLVFLFAISACGDSDEKIDPEVVKECELACDTYFECDPKNNVAVADKRDCEKACEDPSYVGSLRMDEALLDCYRLDLDCVGYSACVNSIGEDGDDSPASWCEAWCRRCSECLTKQPGFGEGMCRDGQKDICLDDCAEHYEGASGDCIDKFNSFNPNQATCKEIDDKSPFESGC